jgi:Secretion system C-terminal sorting domain
MKKYFAILVTFCFATPFLNAQIKDTVSMGVGYANMVWYDIENDVETKAPAKSWDVALSVRGFDATISVNANSGLTYYKQVNSIANWANAKLEDTSKLTDGIYNRDTTWVIGALNTSSKDNGVFDYGWGNYNQGNKNVVGDSFYIFKTIKNDWKKVSFNLNADSSYFIKIANLDGSNEITTEVKKKDYPKKNFVYFSISENKVLNYEPDNDKWDLLFTKYHSVTPDGAGNLVFYTVTGVLQNTLVFSSRGGPITIVGATVAKIFRKDREKDDFDVKKLLPQANTIGVDWRVLNPDGRSFTVLDSVSYFIKNRNSKYFKINFKDFVGSSTGNFIFERKAIIVSSVKDVYNGTASLAVYPNPSNGGNLTLVYDLGKNAQNADFQLVTLTGQAIYNQKLLNTEGVQQLTLPQLSLTSGLYFAVMNFNGKSVVQKLIIK